MNMNLINPIQPWPRLIALLVATVFTADLLLPEQQGIVFAYVLALFLAIFLKEKSDVLLLTVITTVLTIIGAVLNANNMPINLVLLSRFLPILIFWAATFFVIQYITLREKEKQQEEQFKALFEYASSGILLTNQKGEIVMINPAAEQLFGYASGELLHQPIEILIPQRLTKQHQQHRTAYHQSPVPRSMGIGLNLSGQRKNGTEFPVEVSLSPFKSAQGAFVVAFVLDNTYRKNYENSILTQKQELANLTEALQNLNEGLETKVSERTTELEIAKNDLAAALTKERELGELKSRFVSMASHEFRTPLTTVLSSAGLVQQYADRQDFTNVKKHADRIKTAVNGLNAILTEFLSLGRLEEGRVEVNWAPHNIPECVREVHEILKSIFKPGQQLAYTHIGPEVSLVDCNLIKPMLINLISNAIKYSPDHTRIQLVTTADDHIRAISIRDQGVGIPLVEQKHIFDRFFRASNAVNSTSGTGLGLYIIQRYAEMMNGKVSFESEEGKGSLFEVKFEPLKDVNP
jgi:PAS domain S-box-containing protein